MVTVARYDSREPFAEKCGVMIANKIEGLQIAHKISQIKLMQILSHFAKLSFYPESTNSQLLHGTHRR